MHPCVLCVLALGLAACGPALKQSEDFTPKKVRAYAFDDTCKLQGYFDSDAKPIRPASESYLSGSKEGAAVGKATFHVQGRASKMLGRLLDRFYDRVPDPKGEAPVTVTVQFYTRDGNRRLPIGAVTRLSVGDDEDEVELPYHPCLDAFFFGRAHYAMRKRLRVGQQP
jgi:hypothetical protein